MNDPMTERTLRATYDADTEHWLRPIAVRSASGLTYHLTIGDASALRASLTHSISHAIRENHPPLPTHPRGRYAVPGASPEGTDQAKLCAVCGRLEPQGDCCVEAGQ